MTSNQYDQLNLVRTRNREIFDDRFVFQTVWNFSEDGINEEVYIVSAVVSIKSESVCETFIFPARDNNGDDFSAGEVYSSPHFLGHHSDHKLLVGGYLRECAQDQRDESRQWRENLESLFRTS